MSGDQVNVVDRIPYSSLAITPISVALSGFGNSDPLQVYHASLSAPTRGFILGGHAYGTSAPTISNFITSNIKIFDFSTELASNSSNSLDEFLTCLTGSGHSNSGFTFGGNNIVGGKIYWYGSQKIRKLDYGTTLVFTIGEKLPVNMADQGTTSDYMPSLY